MPRKVYPQKLAEQVAERLTQKTGEDHEARMTSGGWAVYAHSEPVEEAREVLNDGVEDAVGGNSAGYVGMGYYTMPKSSYFLMQEMVSKLELALEVGAQKIQAKPPMHGPVYIDMQPPKIVQKKQKIMFKPTKDTPVKKAGPYEAFKEVHGSGKQGSKGGKKALKEHKVETPWIDKFVDWAATVPVYTEPKIENLYLHIPPGWSVNNVPSDIDGLLNELFNILDNFSFNSKFIHGTISYELSYNAFRIVVAHKHGGQPLFQFIVSLFDLVNSPDVIATKLHASFVNYGLLP